MSLNMFKGPKQDCLGPFSLYFNGVLAKLIAVYPLLPLAGLPTLVDKLNLGPTASTPQLPSILIPPHILAFHEVDESHVHYPVAAWRGIISRKIPIP